MGGVGGRRWIFGDVGLPGAGCSGCLGRAGLVDFPGRGGILSPRVRSNDRRGLPARVLCHTSTGHAMPDTTRDFDARAAAVPREPAPGDRRSSALLVALGVIGGLVLDRVLTFPHTVSAEKPEPSAGVSRGVGDGGENENENGGVKGSRGGLTRFASDSDSDSDSDSGAARGGDAPRAVRPTGFARAATSSEVGDEAPSGDSATSTSAGGGSGGAGAEALAEIESRYQAFQGVDRLFGLVADAVAPTVVHIEAFKTNARSGPRDRSAGFDSKAEGGDAASKGSGSGGGAGAGVSPSPSPSPSPGRATVETGSGVLVRPESARQIYVLTNHHVVDGSKPEEIRISLHDGRVLRPLRVWTDPRSDVAVLALGRDDLPTARLGDSDRATVGTWVLAIGSPFGLRHSVTQGIISARGRHEEELQQEGLENQDFLQTDCAINPGNSGGPLVNLRGEVVGINTAIATNHGGSEGVGFSIPINLASWIMDQLIRTGKVTRGRIGVELGDVAPRNFASYGLDRPRGARILNVHPGSPAERGGVRSGDIVLRFNEIEVANLNHLINLVSMSPIGKPAVLVVLRDGVEHRLRLTVWDPEAVETAKRGVGGGAPGSNSGAVSRPSPSGGAGAGSGAVPVPSRSLTPTPAPGSGPGSGRPGVGGPRRY